MTCVSCGKQVPAGARYCVHCGAAQADPTPIAAVAAAMSRASRVQAANAPQADPRPGAASDAANQSAANADAATPFRAIAPAYAGGPNRRGLAFALVAACIVVAAAVALVGWRIQEMKHGEAAAGSPAIAASGAAQANDAHESPATPPSSGGTHESESASPTPEAPAPAQTERATHTEPAQAETAAGSEHRDAGNAPPVEIKPLPPRAATARNARRTPSEPRSPAAADAAPAPAAAATTTSRAHLPTVATALAPTVSAIADRWRRMDDDLSRCTREDFIARVICGQRVRFRYCSGFWGKVAQCPASPAPERGQ